MPIKFRAPQLISRHLSGQISADGPLPLDKLMVMIALGAKLGLGLVSFLALSRYLGPENFGIIAAAIALSVFANVVTDFGLTTFSLREASMAPSFARKVVSDALSGKLILALIAFAAGLPVLYILEVGLLNFCIYIMIYLGVSAYSMLDILFSLYRSAKKFYVEAIVNVFVGGVISVATVVVCFATGSLFFSALAFGGSRVISVIAILVYCKKDVSFNFDLSNLINTIKNARKFAFDSIFTNLSMQMDALVFGFLLVPKEFGVYQAGSRIVQTITPLAMVLATVYLPALSGSFAAKDELLTKKLALKLNAEFFMVSFAVCLLLLFFGPYIVAHIFGNDYSEVNGLWGAFAAFVVLRFSAAAFGIQLTAVGDISIRILAQFASIITFASISVFYGINLDIKVTALIVAVSSVPTILVLGLYSSVRGPTKGWGILMVLASILLAAAFATF